MSTEQAIDIPQGYKMTELGLLPEEWQVVRLGEVSSESYSGGTPSSKVPHYWNGKIPWTTTATINEKDVFLDKFIRFISEEGLRRSSSKIAPKRSVLVGTRVGVGKVVVTNFDIAINQDITVLIFTSDLVPEFFAYLAKTALVQKHFNDRKRGATIKGIPREDLLYLSIPLPPLPEQRAIAHILQTVQDAKEKIEGVIQAAKKLKKSLLKYLFTYGPVPVEDAEKVPLKKTEIGLVPEEWGVIKLTDVIQGSFSGGTPSSKVAKYWNGNIPWTTTSPINVNDVFLNDCLRYISEEGLNNSSSKIAPKGSVLIGTRVGVGKAVVTNIDIAINQDLTALELKSDLLPVFFAYLAKTKVIQSFFLNLKRGATIKGIPRNDLLHMSIPLPPLQIQKRIADVLTVIDKRIEASEARKQALETLFHSLLYNLMRGAIRIPAHMEIRSDPSFISGRV